MMISQSGGRQEEGSEKVPSEISKLMDETVSRIHELEFREDGSEDVEETMYVLQCIILILQISHSFNAITVTLYRRVLDISKRLRLPY